MGKVRLILVGGFLGAGKTTLLSRAARRLESRGSRVGLITNDQAVHLVDTEILLREGVPVGEVSGGCFCCRFDQLLAASQRLVDESQPDIILAEPVGSCTDLSATVLQPLKKLFDDRFRLAPFSVLVDPLRLRESMEGNTKDTFPESVFYIYGKQLEEADLIVLNKADAVSPAEMSRMEGVLRERFPHKPVLRISALQREGVDAWINYVMQDAPAGQQIAEVDYDLYAQGEAVLGWLNAAVELQADAKTDWRAFGLDLVKRMQAEFRHRSAEVAHLKLYLRVGAGSVQLNLTTNRGQPGIQTTEPAEAAPGPASLLINARVHIDPQQLRRIVEKCLSAAAGDELRVKPGSLESFKPARPEPVHRMDAVVSVKPHRP